MPATTNFRVLKNYLRSQAWAFGVNKKLITYNNEKLLAEITGGKEWDIFWNGFVKDFSSQFFFSPRNQKDFFLQTLQSLHSYEDILEDANNAVNRTFDVLGSGDRKLDTPIDWSTDFL